MRLVTYMEAGLARIGAVQAGRIVDLARAQRWLSRPGGAQDISVDMTSLLQARTGLLVELGSLLDGIVAQLPDNEAELMAAGVVRSLNGIQFLPPIQAPGKILCVGLNYPSPETSQGGRPAYPVIFGKFANTLVGHQQPILLPRISQEVACEGELALVIGQSGRHIAPEQALDHLAGCTLANDLTASDLERRSSQWMTGKLPDTFTPLGPVLITLDEMPPLDQLELRTYRNGELVLSGCTGQMFFTVPELISYLSAITTLETGDLILTGSPKGIGSQPAPKVLVNPGDELTVEIDAIGMLVNHAIAEVDYGS